jgi:hypothetical protein
VGEGGESGWVFQIHSFGRRGDGGRVRDLAGVRESCGCAKDGAVEMVIVLVMGSGGVAMGIRRVIVEEMSERAL